MNAGGAPTVVVASDAFKGSLTSLEVADAVRLGLLDAAPGAQVTVVPVADGGEGTVGAALAAGWAPVPVVVHGPTGEPVTATVAVRAAEPLSAGLVSAAPHRSNADPPETTPHTAAPHRSNAEPPETTPHTAAPHRSRGEWPDNPLPDRSEHSAGPTVIVELADACGLSRLPGGDPAPLTASSRGLGEAVLAALDLGAEEVVVGVGGSASTDGGAGLLAALGARLLDASGHDLPDGGGALGHLAHLDLSGLDPRLARTRLVLAADVDNPLLGPTGAAVVFGPQKGATPDDVAVLEEGLTTWAAAVEAALAPGGPGGPGGPGAGSTYWSKLPQPDDPQPGATSTYWSKLPQGGGQGHGLPPGVGGAGGAVARAPGAGAAGGAVAWAPGVGAAGGAAARAPGAGAAGGVGFALVSVLGAERRSGIDVVLDLVGLDAALRGADLVVTGEGSLDAQTLAGKAVTGVVRRAEAHGIPVVAVCGRLALTARQLEDVGVRAAYPLSDLEPDRERSMAGARDLLRRTGARIAADWLSDPPG